jgi:hypothetical protein
MKGTFTLALYIAIGITGAAFGQQPTRQEQASTAALLPALQPAPFSPLGTAGPIVTNPVRPVPLPIVIGRGGRLDEHRATFEGYSRAGAKVELRGPCYSACTLVLAYVEREKLCIAPGAFMAFHAVRGERFQQYMVAETRKMYESYPPEIRRWIDYSGGWHNLPIDGFWTMYDHSLWALGYPKCAP